MTIFILGIVVYFLVVAVIGYVAGSRSKTLDDYLIAGRSLPFYLAVPTIVATWFGAGSSMGVSGTVYSQGFYGVIPDPFGCSLALLLTGLFFAVPFRRLRLTTISDLLRNCYGATFERVSTLIVIPFYVGTLASQMLAMGYIFQIVSGANLEIGVLLGALIVVTYTVSGGMWAVTITDLIQFVLLATGLVLIVPICFEQIQDKSAVFHDFFHEFSTLAPQAETSIDYLSYMGRILMTGLGAIMGQDLIQRILSSRSESVARASCITGAALYMILGLIPLFIGIAGRQIYPELEKSEMLIPFLAKEYLSPLAFTIFACGIFSAIMSTADSYLLAGAALISNNIILKVWPCSEEKSKIKLLRWVNIGMALVALLLSFSGQSIFDMMVHSGAMLFVAIFVPASAGLFWKKAHVKAAWSSMVCGIVGWLGFIAVYHSQFSNAHEDLLFSAAAFGFLTSLASYVVVAFNVARKQPIVTPVQLNSRYIWW